MKYFLHKNCQFFNFYISVDLYIQILSKIVVFDKSLINPKSRFRALSLRVKRSPVPRGARELLRLPRLRAGTPACTKRFGEGRDYGVQARTFSRF